MVAAALGLDWLGQGLGAQGMPPNVVIIVADDLGYGDVGVYGGRDIPTPNIDALARGGIRFTDGYVSSPICSPTRAALMTGRYPQRFGLEFNLGKDAEDGLPLTEITIADRLKAAGYHTGLFGKWHLGAGPGFHPMDRGFDEFFGFLGGEHSYIDTNRKGVDPILDGRKPSGATPYLTDALADHAIEFIEQPRSRPFFLYLAFNAVHRPMQATDKYLDRFQDINDPRRRTYAAMLSAMDDAIGRTIATLRAQNLEENTLIIFFADNGGPTMVGREVNYSSNGPLRGSKRQTYEGGIRVPFIIRWKGHLPEGTTDSRPIIELDVMPTVLAAAGVPVQTRWKLDGVNLLPYLAGPKTSPPHEALFWRLGANMAIRKGDWKLVKTHEGSLRTVAGDWSDLSTAELYNLRDDIGEKHNLAAAHLDKVNELASEWQGWNDELAIPPVEPTLSYVMSGAGGRYFIGSSVIAGLLVLVLAVMRGLVGSARSKELNEPTD